MAVVIDISKQRRAQRDAESATGFEVYQMSKIEGQTRSLQLSGVSLELVEQGNGRPILFLHPWIGLSPDLPFLKLLAQKGHVVAPSHPGFGHSSLPRHFSCVDDLAYFYLDLLEKFDFRDCLVVGISFGAWIAAEMAIKSCERIGSLVLSDPVGIKIGAADEAHIVDYFGIDNDRFTELAYADPEVGRIEMASLSDEEVEIIARNRDGAALFGWLPYMYDPKLCDRLYRIKVPTLVIKGEKDRIISDTYVAEFTKRIPAARLETLPDSGHFPHIEQPQALLDRIINFTSAARVA